MTICPEERCTGCGACQSACPADCITLALNRAGDRVAVIDESRCTRCGKCSRICPVLHPPVLRESRTALAAYAVEAQVRQNSASGGAAACWRGKWWKAAAVPTVRPLPPPPR